MPIAAERGQFVFQKLERNLLRLAAKQRAESVHGFRTTTRRLQTLLEELLPERDRNLKKLLKLLDDIRKRAGKVRNIDVQLAALRSLKIPQEPRRKTQLTHGLIELRAKHEKKLRKNLTKGMIREVRKRLKRASKEVRLEAGCDPLAVARQMLEQVARPTGQLTDDVLHRYRTVVKRARYVAEFAPKSAEGTHFLAQMTRLQDAIGNWHDWLTLTHTAADRLGDVNQSPLVAALHNLTRGKFRHAVAVLSTSPTVPMALKSASASSEYSREAARKTPTFGARTDSAA